MKYYFFRIFVVVVLGFMAVSAGAQSLKFDEVVTCINGSQYPNSVFELVESKGFMRVDKQWLANCDRVVYYLMKDGKPTMFVNPTNCYKLMRNSKYPVAYRNEMELQYQRSSRPEFEAMQTQIKKQCKFLGTRNGSESGEKMAGTTMAYKHEASGVTFVIEDAAPVAFIYVLR